MGLDSGLEGILGITLSLIVIAVMVIGVVSSINNLSLSREKVLADTIGLYVEMAESTDSLMIIPVARTPARIENYKVLVGDSDYELVIKDVVIPGHAEEVVVVRNDGGATISD